MMEKNNYNGPAVKEYPVPDRPDEDDTRAGSEKMLSTLKEPGYVAVQEEVGLRPMFDMDMRLGEGSGCPFTFFMIDFVQPVLKTCIPSRRA